MRLLPWTRVSTWKCSLCGHCCRHYDVVLKLHEWLNIVKILGVECTTSGVGRLLLKRRQNGSCIFLCETRNGSLCSLQRSKPIACRLWPFKILDQPKFGYRKDAVYTCGFSEVYIYVDPHCPGLRFGQPTREFALRIIPEFVQIAYGVRKEQLKSTGRT